MQFMKPFARLQRLYQVRPSRMLETAKKSEVTRLYWIPGGGRIFSRKTLGESFAELGTDFIVKSARRSLVKSVRPCAPSGAGPSSVKIETGTSTLRPALAMTTDCHSTPAAAAAARAARLKTRIQGSFRADILESSPPHVERQSDHLL